MRKTEAGAKMEAPKIMERVQQNQPPLQPKLKPKKPKPPLKRKTEEEKLPPTRKRNESRRKKNNSFFNPRLMARDIGSR